MRPPLHEKHMATIDIHNLSGEKVGTFDLADEIFGAVNEDLLWEAVKHYRAAQRAGTHKTKGRWEVSGSGKKLWKQKGTGPRPYWIDPVTSVAAWLHGAWSAAALLRLCLSQEEAAGRAALGSGCEICRREVDRSECVRREGTEDQGIPQGAEFSESGFDGSGGRSASA